MPEDPLEERLKRHPRPGPSLDLRERILTSCRRELVLRRDRDYEKRQRLVWRGCFILGVAFLLLVNVWEEHRRTSRLVQIIESSPNALAERENPEAFALAFRARSELLARLLRDSSPL